MDFIFKLSDYFVCYFLPTKIVCFFWRNIMLLQMIRKQLHVLYFVYLQLNVINVSYFHTQNVRIVQLAVSLGGVESLIEHPGTMTHGPMLMSDDDRKSGGITDGLVRIRYFHQFKSYTNIFRSK